MNLKYFSLYIFSLIFSIHVHAQYQVNLPKRIAIIQPDTAIIDSSLRVYIDSIEVAHSQKYYDKVNKLEKVLNKNNKNLPKEMQSSLQQDKYLYQHLLRSYKLKEQEVLNFSYYHMLSSVAADVYNAFFNQYGPAAEVFIFKNDQRLPLDKIADSIRADYIIRVDNVHTVHNDDEWEMITDWDMYMYDLGQVITQQRIRSNSVNRGDSWECNNPLACLMINSIANAFEKNTVTIQKMEKRF